MAYEMVKRLQKQKDYSLLNKLQESVTSSDKDRGKKHQVFERSFDCKPITMQHCFIEKLNYINNNPCSGVWKLVENPTDYKHISAKQYIVGEEGEYPIVDEMTSVSILAQICSKEKWRWRICAYRRFAIL
jgi:hypothetical protein